MRHFAQVHPAFWTGQTGRQLRSAGRDAQLVALYLITCPSAQATGLYHLALPTLCHESGLGRAGALAALAALKRLDFAYMDEAEEVVFVPAMARFQIGEALAEKDKRRSWVRTLLQPWRGTHFYRRFLALYSDAYRLAIGPPERATLDCDQEDSAGLEGPSKEHASPSDASPRHRDGDGVESRSGDGNGMAAGDAAAPPPRIRILADGELDDSPIFVAFPARAFKSGSLTSAELSQAFVDGLKLEYEGIDVERELKRAARWAHHPENRAKAKVGSRGVRRFISNWLSRAEADAERARGNPR